ncbi:hypothetical protein VCHA53O466_320032 [Vibrio chagasii]|nr:hypothetical protein VCHA53O466_320032 [Vibrio chagasii]
MHSVILNVVQLRDHPLVDVIIMPAIGLVVKCFIAVHLGF